MKKIEDLTDREIQEALLRYAQKTSENTASIKGWFIFWSILSIVVSIAIALTISGPLV